MLDFKLVSVEQLIKLLTSATKVFVLVRFSSEKQIYLQIPKVTIKDYLQTLSNDSQAVFRVGLNENNEVYIGI